MKLLYTTFEDMSELEGIDEMLDNLVTDEYNKQDITESLKRTQMIKAYNGEELGFITVEGLDLNQLEVHFYIPKKNRRYTRQIIDVLYHSIFNNTNYTSVVTSVTEDSKYVIRFLTMLGFKVTSETPNCIHKNGKPLSVTNLILRKEFYNG